MTVNDEIKWMMLNYNASSLYSVVADGEYQETTAGRRAWKSLIVGSSLQRNCNKEGFNIFYSSENEIRLGYLANNQRGCRQSDSCIGFGIFYKACYSRTISITCGNIALCAGNDNGTKITPAFGYILVQ